MVVQDSRRRSGDIPIHRDPVLPSPKFPGRLVVPDMAVLRARRVAAGPQPQPRGAGVVADRLFLPRAKVIRLPVQDDAGGQPPRRQRPRRDVARRMCVSGKTDPLPAAPPTPLQKYAASRPPYPRRNPARKRMRLSARPNRHNRPARPHPPPLAVPAIVTPAPAV